MARAQACWLANCLGIPASMTEEPEATPAAAASHKDLGPDKWLMDTGCGSDLIGIDDIPKFNLEKMLTQCTSEIQLHTANGITTVQNEVILQVKNLREEVTALVLDSTPPVLSIGKRCMDLGWAFHWEPYSKPWIVTPDGCRIELQVYGNVPYLVERACAHPASQISIAHEPVLDEAGPIPQGVEGGDLLKREDVRDLKAEALSISHLMTHNPKNPHCSSCQRAKMQAKPAPRRKNKHPEDAPTVFGEQVTADHLIAQDIGDESILGDKVALVVLDRATRWLACYPLLSKGATDAAVALADFMGKEKMQSFYSDNSPELAKIARDEGWRHPTSTPGRPDTNGVAERAVRKVCEGTRTALVHAGLHPKWWCYAARHFCFSNNITTVNGESPWRQRHKEVFKGPLLPFGCLVDFKPSPVKGKVGPKFASKAEAGIFLGYHTLPGGRFHGDYWVASLSSFRESLTGDGGSVQIQRVGEVYKDKAAAFEFPLKALYDKARRTISSGDDQAAHEFPGPSDDQPGGDPPEPAADGRGSQEPAAELGDSAVSDSASSGCS